MLQDSFIETSVTRKTGFTEVIFNTFLYEKECPLSYKMVQMCGNSANNFSFEVVYG